MSIWFAIPSARPVDEAIGRLEQWRKQGYRIALLRQGEPLPADLLIPTNCYRGWAQSVNILAREILARDPLATWIVTGGDDYLPDPGNQAESIGQQCFQYFRGTFGVMQPTGDRWGEELAWARDRYPEAPAFIDRICGSPWLGREWCQRAYGGRGPLWGDYLHMFADEELQLVAKLLGVFWQRRDLIQKHDHWMRYGSEVPEFLKPVNTSEHWETSRNLFRARRASGFPDSAPLPIGETYASR